MMLKLRVSAFRPARTAAVALFVTMFALCYGCVSSGKYKSLEEERNALSERNRGLQDQVKVANEKGEGLAGERSALATEKADLEARLAQVQEQEKALGSQLQQHEEEARQSKATYDGLL